MIPQEIKFGEGGETPWRTVIARSVPAVRAAPTRPNVLAVAATEIDSLSHIRNYCEVFLRCRSNRMTDQKEKSDEITRVGIMRAGCFLWADFSPSERRCTEAYRGQNT